MAEDDASAVESMFKPILLAHRPEVGWDNATKVWGKPWKVYLYSTLVINTILLVWTFINIVFILRRKALVSRIYFLSLNVMVLLFAVTRLVHFSLDPYGMMSILPEPLGNILLNMNFPLLTVGFSVLYVGLRQYTRPTKVSILLTKPWVVVAFSSICFLISVLTDVLVAYVHSTELMILICQCFYIVWSFVFFALFLHLLVALRRLIVATNRKKQKMCYKLGHCRRGMSQRRLESMPASVKICGVSAVLFLIIGALNIYLVLAEIGLIQTESYLMTMCKKFLDVWPFFGFHATLQLCEHLMAVSLVVCGTQPARRMQLRCVQHQSVSEDISTMDLGEYPSDRLPTTSTTTTSGQLQPELSLQLPVLAVHRPASAATTQSRVLRSGSTGGLLIPSSTDDVEGQIDSQISTSEPPLLQHGSQRTERSEALVWSTTESGMSPEICCDSNHPMTTLDITYQEIKDS